MTIVFTENELEYINKEKQQEILKKHNIKYDDTEV